MKKTLIIVRHGNTFLPDQTPTRVGRGTDLPLVEEKRGRAVGRYLASLHLNPSKVYAAPLKRTTQTAKLILDELQIQMEIIPEKRFIEVDYGPDENKNEDEVRLRLGHDYFLFHSILNASYEEKIKQGKDIIDKWDLQGAVPSGWKVDVDAIISNWTSFSDSIEDGDTVLLCSSNGIIRFAPHILNVNYEDFCSTHNIKVATGSVSIFEFEDGKWTCKEWNTKPYNIF